MADPDSEEVKQYKEAAAQEKVMQTINIDHDYAKSDTVEVADNGENKDEETNIVQFASSR